MRTETSNRNETSQEGAAELDVAQLYRDHARLVSRTVRRLTGEGPQVDDLTQEVFVVAHRHLTEFERRSSVETWLYGITANLCMNHRRGKRRYGLFRERVEGEPIHWESDTPDASLERKQTVASVHETLQRLPFKQREVFVLYELEEKEGVEIAEMIGIPLGTVWTRLHQARKTFKKLYKKQQARTP